MWIGYAGGSALSKDTNNAFNDMNLLIGSAGPSSVGCLEHSTAQY